MTEVFRELNDTVANMLVNPERISMAQRLHHYINLKRLCILVKWNRILNHIDKVNSLANIKNVSWIEGHIE
jgi:hypothetical protein